jgi:hypothetical protein
LPLCGAGPRPLLSKLADDQAARPLNSLKISLLEFLVWKPGWGLSLTCCPNSVRGDHCFA